MNTKRTSSYLIAFVFLACCLSACTGTQPKLIGAYSSAVEPKPLAELPRGESLPGVQFTYEAWITLKVSQVTSTAERAVDLASLHGGYLENSSSLLQDGRTHITLVLAVPAAGFDALREDLIDLGKLENEQVSSDWTRGDLGWPNYSHITLTLEPRAAATITWPKTRWNPAETFRQALDVFVSIFGFLADLLIWAVVVAGPFVLIALGLRLLWRKVH
ncbi:MAG: DUF4349 domain-containing protein [Anaerolineales bacterium]|jgi:hypothetical protein|nr:DUF4349 domain-containing protein [Anaerolineales bacterium]